MNEFELLLEQAAQNLDDAGTAHTRMAQVTQVIIHDMCRLTCIVHERIEDFPAIVLKLYSKSIPEFLVPNTSLLAADFPKLCAKLTLWARDETERQLGVKK